MMMHDYHNNTVRGTADLAHGFKKQADFDLYQYRITGDEMWSKRYSRDIRLYYEYRDKSNKLYNENR